MSNNDHRSLRAAANCHKVKFSLPVFARRLEEIGVPITIGETGNFIRRDAVLSAPVNDLVLQYLAEHLFKKWEGKDGTVDRKAAARQRFDEAEELCRLTNERFSCLTRHHGEFQPYLDRAKANLERLLGTARGRSDHEARSDLLYSISGSFDFGPGASTQHKRVKSDKAYKYSVKPEVTVKCAYLARTLIGLSPMWTHIASLEGDDLVKKTPGNRVVTVPKNYKTERTIAIEPDMNMYIQKGLGGHIRKRLKQVGIDLDDQSVNQKLAYEGSLDSSLATIDLSMASDTVSRRLCQYLFPSHISDFIEETRCEYGVHSDGTVTYYQKVSSMGNGYTFELESSLFWALSEAVIHINGTSDHRFSVYGDDIIVPSPVVPELFRLLDYCGFKLNSEKSFWTGYFRESCGKHYYKGSDVSPFYIKRTPSTNQQVMLLHNQLWRWRDRCAELLSQPQWDTLTKVLQEMKAMCSHRYRRLVIPDGYGDGGFVGYADEIVIHRKGKRSKHRFFDVILVPARCDVAEYDSNCDVPGLLVKSLLRCETVGPNKTGFTLADRVNDCIKVRDGLEIFPALQAKRAAETFLEIPTGIFFRLGYSDAFFTHHNTLPY